jgi:hypothetical protein
VLDQQEVDEASEILFGHAPARTPRDHQVDPAGPLHGSEHDLTSSFLEDPSEDGSLFRIEVNHARGLVGGSRSLPIAQPASRGGQGTSSVLSVRIRHTIDASLCVRRSTVGSPGGLGSGGARGSLQAVGEYEFRVKRRDRGVSDDYAIRRARETAFADGVKLSGDPIVRTKRVPLPWIGPRTEFIVRFPGATRRF